MVFEVLGQKYKCGCGRGMNELKIPGLLGKINELAEWELIRFPKTKQIDVEIEGETVLFMQEDRDFLGTPPELKPGNCILLGGQVIAFDSSDRMVLVVSETGGLSLNRIYEEIVNPEWELVNIIDNRIDFDYEDAPDDISEFDGSVPIPYVYYKVWKELYLNGEEKNLLIKLNDLFGIEIVLGKWDCKYKTSDWDEGDEDMIKDFVFGILGWFCRFNKRDNSEIDNDQRIKDELDIDIKNYIENKKPVDDGNILELAKNMGSKVIGVGPGQTMTLGC